MAVLPTNYLDDILAASMGGKRRFRITHEDGSTEEVTLEDVSEYEQVGSPFGSGDVNKTNQAVNEKLDSADVVDPALATVLGFAADAKLTGDALSELNKNSIKLKKYDANLTGTKTGFNDYPFDCSALQNKNILGFIPVINYNGHIELTCKMANISSLSNITISVYNPHTDMLSYGGLRLYVFYTD